MIGHVDQKREWVPVNEAREILGSGKPIARSTIFRRLKSGTLTGRYNTAGRLEISVESIDKLTADLPRFGER